MAVREVILKDLAFHLGITDTLSTNIIDQDSQLIEILDPVFLNFIDEMNAVKNFEHQLGILTSKYGEGAIVLQASSAKDLCNKIYLKPDSSKITVWKKFFQDDSFIFGSNGLIFLTNDMMKASGYKAYHDRSSSLSS